MADTSREPALERTDFQELEEAEDLFPEPAAAQEEVSGRRRRRCRGGRGERGGQGVKPPADRGAPGPLNPLFSERATGAARGHVRGARRRVGVSQSVR
ncbi:unnamed protein product [Pleuronectes platessa]|uniref:Uncharacterized protein n=1 Tax=Pleuronectes platessa TaxID=8262 RepID=A0A9N7TXU0_PLEPL|nr:unnamed protein product [Pleuronectes platessa]